LYLIPYKYSINEIYILATLKDYLRRIFFCCAARINFPVVHQINMISVSRARVSVCFSSDRTPPIPIFSINDKWPGGNSPAFSQIFSFFLFFFLFIRFPFAHSCETFCGHVDREENEREEKLLWGKHVCEITSNLEESQATRLVYLIDTDRKHMMLTLASHRTIYIMMSHFCFRGNINFVLLALATSP